MASLGKIIEMPKLLSSHSKLTIIKTLDYTETLNYKIGERNWFRLFSKRSHPWHVIYNPCHVTMESLQSLSSTCWLYIELTATFSLKILETSLHKTRQGRKRSRARVPIEGQCVLLKISLRINFFDFFKSKKYRIKHIFLDIVLNPWKFL